MKTIEQKFEAIKEWVAAQESFPDREPDTGEIMAKKRSGCLDVWIGSRPADRIVLNIETPLEKFNYAEVLAIYAILGFDARDAVQAALAEIHAKATIVIDRLPLHDYTTDKNEDCYLPKSFIDSLGDLELLIESQKKGGAGK